MHHCYKNQNVKNQAGLTAGDEPQDRQASWFQSSRWAKISSCRLELNVKTAERWWCRSLCKKTNLPKCQTIPLNWCLKVILMAAHNESCTLWCDDVGTMLLFNQHYPQFFSIFPFCLHYDWKGKSVDSPQFQRKWRTSLMWLNVPWCLWIHSSLPLRVVISGPVAENRRSHYQFTGPAL